MFLTMSVAGSILLPLAAWRLPETLPAGTERNERRERVAREASAEDLQERVAHLEAELAKLRALLERLAAEPDS